MGEISCFSPGCGNWIPSSPQPVSGGTLQGGPTGLQASSRRCPAPSPQSTDDLASSSRSLPWPSSWPRPTPTAPLWPPALSFTSSNPSSSRLSGPRVICLKRKIDHLLSHLKLALAPQCPSVLAGIQDLLELAVLMYHSLPLEPAVPSPLSVPNRQAGHVGHVTAVRGQPSVAAHHAAMGLPGCPLLLCGPDLQRCCCHWATAVVSPGSHGVWAFWKHHFE